MHSSVDLNGCTWSRRGILGVCRGTCGCSGASGEDGIAAGWAADGFSELRSTLRLADAVGLPRARLVAGHSGRGVGEAFRRQRIAALPTPSSTTTIPATNRISPRVPEPPEPGAVGDAGRSDDVGSSHMVVTGEASDAGAGAAVIGVSVTAGATGATAGAGTGLAGEGAAVVPGATTRGAGVTAVRGAAGATVGGGDAGAGAGEAAGAGATACGGAAGWIAGAVGSAAGAGAGAGGGVVGAGCAGASVGWVGSPGTHAHAVAAVATVSAQIVTVSRYRRMPGRPFVALRQSLAVDVGEPRGVAARSNGRRGVTGCGWSWA